MSENLATDDEAIVADPNVSGSRVVLFVAAAVLLAGSLFGTISASGIWDPPELKVADLARRIALNLLGATGLSVVGGVNTVPTAGELGRGELPFTSVALFFRVFGLSEWAGRLPMALWGLVAALATYLLLARLVDRVSGAFAVVVLATCPLFFLQARTILGDVVAMAGLALATAGLSIAVFDARATARGRAAWALFGAFGLVVTFGARGVLVGVAVPALAVGLARLVRKGTATEDRLGTIIGGLCLLLGIAAVALAVRALLVAEEHQFSRLLGGTLSARQRSVTYDSVVVGLGHGLLPWSAVVPFALGRLLLAPVGVEGDAFERESSLRLVVSLVAILAFGAYGVLGPRLGVPPFGAVFALAAAVAITFRDFERGAPVSRVMVLGVAALLVLFYEDLKHFPEKGLSAFGVDDAKLPDSFKDRANTLVKGGAVLSAAAFALFLEERTAPLPQTFSRELYRGYPRRLREAHEGNLFFGLVAGEASLLVLAVATWVSDRYAHWAAFEGMTVPLRYLSRYGFMGLPLLVAAPLFGLAARDACRWAFRRFRITRAVAALSAIAAFGAVMSFAYYPTLARQMSPKDVFDSFRRAAKPGEELGMIGGGSSTARYYAQREVRTFSNSTEAFTWLTERDEARRWLVLRAADVGQLNSQYRARRAPAKNLPILDARSSEILLASNVLRPGEANENPLAKWVLDRVPRPKRRLDVDFNGQLHGIGWDVTTPEGEPVEWVRAGKPYAFRFYYEVQRAVSGDWQTFIHVDGYQRRYNGDHDTLEGKYPFNLWRVGDYIVDVHPFELEPNFTAGTYTVYYGLFRGDQRLAVKRGPADDNRVTAGPLVVR